MAQLALGVAGAAVGFAVGGPVGMQIGWVAGSLLGSAVDPQRTQGPRLADLHTQISSYGAFIPQVWGTIRTGGIVIWATDKEEHENTSGGKGGPEVTTFSYTQSFDTIICRSRGGTRLLRMWANGRLIYDNRTGTVVTGADLPFVFYDGADDQTADPTEEAIIGSGMVPAYRGVSRVVFTDLDLSEFGNAIPQLNFEIATNQDEQPLSRSATWTAGNPLTLTAQTLSDHRSVDYDDDGNIRVSYWVTTGVAIPNYNTPGGTPIPWRTLTYDADGTLLSTADVTNTLPNGQVYLCRNGYGLSYHQRAGGGSRWYKDGVMVADQDVDAGVFSVFYSCDEEFVYYDGNVYTLARDNEFTSPGGVRGWLVRFPAPGGVPEQTYDIRYALSTTSYGGSFTVQLSNDGHLLVNGEGTLRKFDADLNLVETWTATGGSAIFPQGGTLMARGQWMVCADKLLLRYINPDSTASYVLYEMNNPLPFTEIARVDLIDTTPPGNGQLWNLHDGLALVEDGMLSVCFIDAATVLHGDIVADVCEECGLDPSEFDVSELVDRERGVMTTQIMTGRAFIESLMPIRFYDAVDSDTGIKFVKRGKASAVTVPDDDLAGHGENEEIPDKLEIVRGNDDELPSTMFIKYFNFNADYQMGTQLWRRQTGISKVTQEVNVAMVLDDGEAKRIVDAWGAEIWNARDKYKWSTLQKYVKYEPTDVQTVRGIELRVEKQQEHRAEGKITWEGIRSRPGNFAQPGVGGEADGFPTQDIPEPQETEALILDIPLMPDEHRQLVTYVGMQGALRRSWRGAAWMKSIDGGTNYDQLLSQSAPDSMGTCETQLGNFGGPSVDEASILTVLMGPGAAPLASITRQEMFAGANMCAIGAEGGGYEIAHFMDADLVDEEEDGSRTYDVSRFLRGRRGTENFKKGHAAGDRFIVLPTKTIMDTPRTDVGRTRHYKAVTFGRAVSTADPIEFRSAGISLAALAPVNLGAGFNGDGDCIMQWDRRSRISFGWVPQVPQPLGEEVERYRIRIYEDGTKQTVVRTDYSDTQEYTYSEADQITDFGGALSVPPAWDVAQKCLTGWGWASDGGRPTLVLEDFPGYVPPNPAPSDTTYYVNSTMTYVSGSQVQALALTPNQTWAIAVTVNTTPTTLNDLVGLVAFEFSGPPVPRIWTFSPIKGDFAPQSAQYAYNLEGSPYPSVQFQVINNTNPGYPVVPSGATWYFNIRTLPTTYTSVPMYATISNVP